MSDHDGSDETVEEALAKLHIATALAHAPPSPPDPPPPPRLPRLVTPGPIHKLPPEILAQALCQVLDMREDKPRMRRRARSSLRRVSKHFRAVMDEWDQTAVLSGFRAPLHLKRGGTKGKGHERIRRVVVLHGCLRGLVPTVLVSFSNAVELRVISSENISSLRTPYGCSIRHLEVGKLEAWYSTNDGLTSPPSHLTLESMKIRTLAEDGLEDLSQFLFSSHDTLRTLFIHRHSLDQADAFFGDFLSQFTNLETLLLGPFSDRGQVPQKPLWKAISKLAPLRTLIVSTQTANELIHHVTLPSLDDLVVNIDHVPVHSGHYADSLCSRFLHTLASLDFRFATSDLMPATGTLESSSDDLLGRGTRVWFQMMWKGPNSTAIYHPRMLIGKWNASG